LECDPPTFQQIVGRCKKVLHRYGIHSSTVQPEFIPRDLGGKASPACKQNCASDCIEEWLKVHLITIDISSRLVASESRLARLSLTPN